MAVQWCDAWEFEAERQGISHDRAYWSHGTHWIWGERAAGRLSLAVATDEAS